MRIPFVAMILCTFLLCSCGSSRRTTSSVGRTSAPEKDMPGFEHEILGNSRKLPGRRKEPAIDEVVVEENKESASLYDFVSDWKGTPHKMGGNTKKGVDCSGFVIQVYKQIYASPFTGRRAEDIFSETTPVRREKLQEGDLVFFKINGRRIDHVGVYLKNGEFAHASSSRGVMISHLDEAYYKKRFFMGGRVKE